MQLDLYSGSGKLSPLSYSSGKTQLDVIQEVLEALNSSETVWLNGRVGTGKSVIGLKVALKMGGGTVSVPTKVLARQYMDDYCRGNLHFKKPNGEKAVIEVFEGRRNFQCPWIQEQENYEDYRNTTCSNPEIPCRISLGSDETRLETLKSCSYGGAIMNQNFVPNDLEGYRQYPYIGVGGFFNVLLKGGCPYYDQHAAYSHADVLAMNSHKLRLEAVLGRLPWKPLVIIDEADHFLDSICRKVVVSQKRVNRVSKRLMAARDALKQQISIAEEDRDFERHQKLDAEVEKITGLNRSLVNLRDEFFDNHLEPFEAAEKFVNLLTGVEAGAKIAMNLQEVLDHRDEADFHDERDKSDNPKGTYFIADPAPVLKKFLETLNAKVLFMSATKPSNYVMREVFKIEPEEVIGESTFPGTLVQRRTGKEFKVSGKRENWSRNRNNRKRFYDARDTCIKRAKEPVFVPVHATKYAPDKIRNQLTDNQSIHHNGAHYSTKMDRGADLNEMNSVVLLKYPYPSLGDPQLRAMKKRLGNDRFWQYYRDMARRDFIQQIGRTTRSPDAKVEFWSPDATCHQKLATTWKGKIMQTF